jgi:thiamine pyrophosphate-dependent acetolactate synthase large subunit-like protein
MGAERSRTTTRCASTPRVQTALAGADAILMVGGRFNWIFQFGRGRRFAPGTRIAHIDVEPSEFYSAADVEVGLTADCAVAVDQLVQALAGRTLRVASSGWAINSATTLPTTRRRSRPISPPSSSPSTTTASCASSATSCHGVH